MSDLEKLQLQEKITDLEQDFKELEELRQKEITKHLDNPSLRGMVTTKEMLSFPKVAKGVKAEFNAEYQGYNWRVKANDGSILNYGERDYGKGHRLLTAHSRTERGERGQPHRQIYDLNFHNSADNIITQNKEYGVNKKDTNSETEKGQRKIEKTERGQRQADRVSSATYFNDPDFRGSVHNEIIPQEDEIKNKECETKTNTLIDAIINARKDLNYTIRAKDILMQDVEFNKEDLKDNSQILQSEMTNTSKNINKRLKQ
ncbi:hypothetical protein CHLV4139_08630 [Campylobacter helveticus]|uniref:hypothetical protein n=1 Tax=Campylobacter helveticus TaxID=28898 RepID=UPI00214A8E1F|nr:hypothetical protein [Campylobacter helveticus]MCR2055550.1 hypothetical protein [Campylobacter helveticus]